MRCQDQVVQTPLLVHEVAVHWYPAGHVLQAVFHAHMHIHGGPTRKTPDARPQPVPNPFTDRKARTGAVRIGAVV